MAEVKYLDKTGLSSVWSKVKGIVTPKADKVSGATAGHLAGLNSSGNLTDSGLAASNIAQKDGSYSGMTVGAAEDLVSAESVASEFTSRVTGGSTAVGKGGTALVDKIKGRTLVWNQLVQQSYGSSVTPNEVTITVANDGKFTLSGTASASGGRTSYVSSTTNRIPIISGHKYLSVNGAPSTLAPYVILPSSTSTLFQVPNGVINTASTTFDGRLGFNLTKDINYDGVSFYLSLFDLTLMFGAGNEPATAEEFEALYPGPYYDYNPGTLISNAATAIETVGWNQYVPATGKARVIGGKQYHVGGTYTSLSKDGATITPDASGLFTPDTSGEVTVVGGTSTDTIISLSDPSRNGTYEPYWRSELELGLGDIKVKSHNIWDEEWEIGAYNDFTGASVITTNNLRSKENNPISVLPNTVYCFTGGAFRVLFYDSEKNFISKVNVASGNTATTPANCGYIRFYMSSGYGVTYLNDICINLSDPGFNGHYEPYGDGGVISITGGLKSAGTVYDEISGGKLVKRIESVDMGTPTWSYNSSTAFMYVSGENFPNMPNYGGVICPKYNTIALSELGDKAISTGGDSYRLIVKDSAYTDAAAFKSAMAGVPLYYQLAQPIEYELAEAIPTAMRNDPYGTERRLPEDTAAIVTAPFRADITYSTNIKEAVQSLPQNYINVNSMQDFLAELGAQMGGTWTMRPADGKFDFTFTPNPSNE